MDSRTILIGSNNMDLVIHKPLDLLLPHKARRGKFFLKVFDVFQNDL